MLTGLRQLSVVFNPLDRELEATLVLPLYYTGLTDTATVRIEDGPPVRHTLDRQFQLPLPLRVAARSWTWLVIE